MRDRPENYERTGRGVGRGAFKAGTDVTRRVRCPALRASRFPQSLPAPGQHPPGRVGERFRGASSPPPRSRAVARAGLAQLHNPPSLDTGRSLGGKRLTQLPALRPPALPRGTCVSRRGRELELAPEPRRVRPATTAPPATRSRARFRAKRPRGPGLQLPSGAAAGPMAGAGACGERRLRGGLSKRPRDWLRGRTAARGLWEAE